MSSTKTQPKHQTDKGNEARLRKPLLLQSNTRAVTEMLGYSIMFGVIIIFIIGTSAVGIGLLDAEESAQATTTMERQFTEIDAEIMKTMNGAPSNIRILDIPTGSLGQGEKTTISITGTATNGTDTTITIETTPITYNAPRSEEIVYDARIIGVDRYGQEQINTTSISYAPNRRSLNASIGELVLPELIPLNNTPAASGQTGSSPVTFQMKLADENQNPKSIAFDATEPISITVDTNHPHVWASFFNQLGYTVTESDISSGTITITDFQNEVQSDTLIINSRTIEFGFNVDPD